MDVVKSTFTTVQCTRYIQSPTPEMLCLFTLIYLILSWFTLIYSYFPPDFHWFTPDIPRITLIYPALLGFTLIYLYFLWSTLFYLNLTWFNLINPDYPDLLRITLIYPELPWFTLNYLDMFILKSILWLSSSVIFWPTPTPPIPWWRNIWMIPYRTQWLYWHASIIHQNVHG